MANSEDSAGSLFALQHQAAVCSLVDTKWCRFFTLGGCKVRWPRQAPQPSVVLSLKLGMKHRIQMEGHCACPAEKVKSTCLGVREASVQIPSLPAVTTFSTGTEPIE